MIPGKVLVTGAAGQLGRQLVTVFREQGWEVIAPGHGELDIADLDAVGRLAARQADVIVNAAAWTDVDGCALDPDRALLVNGVAAGRAAEAAAAMGALSVQISSNEVFDGAGDRPYVEDDEANPINPYGASKLAGERAVAAANPRHLIVRTAWIFGPGGSNFPTKILEIGRRQRAAGAPLRVVSNEVGNPTWAPDLARAIYAAVGAVGDGRLSSGPIHLCGEPAVSRFDWAARILEAVPGVELVPIDAADYPRASRVPLRAVLDTSRARSAGIDTIEWTNATDRFAAELAAGAVS
jgi:dTDP-4-dehydrorhamnose reductase